jgi:hypothetical protein
MIKLRNQSMSIVRRPHRFRPEAGFTPIEKKINNAVLDQQRRASATQHADNKRSFIDSISENTKKMSDKDDKKI